MPFLGSDFCWLAGKDFSLADISLAVLLGSLQKSGLGKKFWEGKGEHLSDFYARMQKGPIFVKLQGRSMPIGTMIRMMIGPCPCTIALLIAILAVGAGILIYKYKK